MPTESDGVSGSLPALARAPYACGRLPCSRIPFPQRTGAREPVGATENITVLFTDLVDSTAMTSALTLEAGGELRRKHFSALRQAIAASGGTEVKNLGDGLMVAFSIASAALSCAVEMQQAVDRDNGRAERPLGLRIGLSAGEVVRESDDFFGDPVIEAARLCAQADGSQILVADLVRAMAGRRSPHAFASLGQIGLKGLPEPIETLEVVWEPFRETFLDAAERAVALGSRTCLCKLRSRTAAGGSVRAG